MSKKRTQTMHTFASLTGFTVAILGLFIPGPLDRLRFFMIYRELPYQYVFGTLFAVIPVISWGFLAWLLLRGEKPGQKSLGRSFLTGLFWANTFSILFFLPTIVSTAVVDSGPYWVILWVIHSGALASSFILGFMLWRDRISKRLGLR